MGLKLSLTVRWRQSVVDLKCRENIFKAKVALVLVITN